MILTGVDYYPEQWDESLWESDAERMAVLGIRVVRIGEFAWSALEPEENTFHFEWLDKVIQIFTRYHISIILGTPTNCPPRWMFQKYPETVQQNQSGQRLQPNIRGERCISSPVFLKFAERIIENMAARYGGKESIYAWQIDNELESNHCTCSYCTHAFQKWAEKKYKTIQKLNKAWGTAMWSGTYSDWEQIEPPILTEGRKTDWYNPAYMLDYERFCSESSAEYVQFQCSIIRRYDPNAVITTNSCFGKYTPDYHSMYQTLNVAGYDNYPPTAIPDDPQALYSNAFVLDLVRGFKQKNFWILEQLGGPMGCWMPIKKQLVPGMMNGYAMQAVAHGADLVSFFRWRTAASGAEMFCYGLLNHDNHDNARIAELKEYIQRVNKINGLSDTSLISQAAMIYSPDQEYSIKNQAQSEGFAYWTQMRLFHEACMNLGVNIDIIPEGTDLSKYKTVIVPEYFVVHQKTVEQLEEFAGNGNSVIITNRSGVKDENGCCIINDYLPTVFTKLCGCHVTETDAIGTLKQRIRSVHGGVYQVTSWCDLVECDTCEPVAEYLDSWYAGTAAVTVNKYGKGKAYYIGTVGEKNLYRSLMLEIFSQDGIPTIDNLPAGIESTVRSNPNMQFRFFFNNTEKAAGFIYHHESVSLKPFEMKILTQSGEWI